MVQAPGKRRALFAAFVLPALFFYGLFFIVPFIQGLRISFTNWDGLTPKSPVRTEKEQFEATILDHLTRDSDRLFLRSIYTLEENGENYSRLAIGGLRRYHLEAILHRIGYEPETYKTVGMRNYRDIFTGGVEERFYPRRYQKTYYNPASALPVEIAKEEFETKILPKLDAKGRALAAEYYVRDGELYRIRPEKDEFEIEDRIWLLPEVESGALNSMDVDSFIAGAKKTGLDDDRAGYEESLAAFTAQASLSPEGRSAVAEAGNELWSLGAWKRLLAATWVEKGFDLGVLGFTAFFALGNVILANLLAFCLALALDQKLRSRNVLRSVFFLPNVLSMIVVALIWSFVFFHLLPRLTGIERWMGDSTKAPWLLVLVSTWQAAGYYMVVYLAGLQNVPPEIIEAARIDGAGAWERLRRITLPLLVPAFTVALFLSLANALKSFDLVYAMVGPTGYALGTVPYVMDIFFDAFAKKMAGLATAKASLLFIAILVLTGVQLLVMKRKEVEL